MRKTQEHQEKLSRLFVGEDTIQALTGLSVKTLQKHRLFGKGFPFYRVGRRVLYDLDEVEAIIRASRVVCDGGKAE